MLIKDPLVASKIAKWREMEANGTLTIEDMREIVLQARQGRTMAAEASRASTKGAKRPVQSAEEMLDEIDRL
jgi:hypothetical protein